MNFAERTFDVSRATLIENHATYHRACYSNYTNESNIDCARKRYHEAVETGDTSVVKQKAGRSSLNNSNALEECEGLTTRSRGDAIYEEHLHHLSKTGWEAPSDRV